ncbi:hypothetical protein [Thalassobius sp. Cn5-15]|uniref:hypothetical protein n=1 Tax=Thalassobius sp. Cn5-15 TaxID=2917763 RepID=UPI001EF25F6B|nr:hypothetical protein [Thalassobius sp. Cn5-15]MCG7494438.1 hypothetical protein [Thalassobius sp. Cn5-15]
MDLTTLDKNGLWLDQRDRAGIESCVVPLRGISQHDKASTYVADSLLQEGL